MPTINNETVIGSGYVTYRNARPQLLSNGWIVAAVYNSTTYRLQFRVKKSVVSAWEDLAYISASSVVSWAISIKGNRIFTTFHVTSSSATYFSNFDAATIPANSSINFSSIDNTSNGSYSGEDLAINDGGTELHHAFSAKTATYPNSFNIRYLKGVIAGDGSVTWSSVIQVTTLNTSGEDYRRVSLSLNASNRPVVFYDFIRNTGSGTLYAHTFDGTAWTQRAFLGSPTFNEQTSISPMFIPQSVNGLSNGRLWIAWHGKDSTDSAKFNIRTSYSDDGGVTWSTPTKQTTGNAYDQINTSLTADSQGKVLLTWDAQNATTTQTALKVFSNGTWGATTTLTGDGYTNASTLFDNTFKLSMTTPPLIRQSTSGVYFSGNYFTGASVSPASGALGDKTASSVLSYTVTPESGSTITSIVEKVNGTTVNTYSNPASLSRTFTIPLTNWDALKYYNTHTISVTVTDSNGMANTQTYTFNKALANDASLLEGAKAAKDGKDRISTKRDVLAGQVGLAAGSTFDAISAQLASGNALKKFASGTRAWSTGASYAQSSYTISGLTFTPSFVVVIRDTPKVNNSYYGTGVFTGSEFIGMPASGNASISNQAGVYNVTTSENAFTVSIVGSTSALSGTFTWYAFS